MKDNKLSQNSPYIVSVNKDETENFINDIMKGAAQLKTPSKNNHKALFVKSFLFGFIFFFLGAFLLYSAYYYVNHALLHKSESCSCQAK